MLNIQMIMPEQVDNEWPRLEKYIARVGRRVESEFTTAELKEKCRGDNGWLLIDLGTGAAIVNREGDSLHIASLGGDFTKGWTESALLWIELAAKLTKAQIITLKGRKGWLRLFKRYGWEDIGDGYIGKYHGRRCE